LSDIFREVDEELRQDRLRAFWSRHGWLVVIAAAGIVLGVAGARGYQAWDRSRSDRAGAEYSRALELLAADDPSPGLALLGELGTDAYASYPTIARLRRAAALDKQGRPDEAVAEFDAVAGERGVDPLLRDVARIRAAYILVDTAPVEQIRARLEPLTGPDQPWRHGARELIALALYRTGDHAGADAEYDRLMSDPAVPVGPRGRAEMMRALIAPHLAAGGK